MSKMIRKSFLSTLFLCTVGLLATGCGAPEEGFDDVEHSETLASVKQGLGSWAAWRSGVNSNLCLDVKDGVATSGTSVQIYTCNGTSAQQWYYDSYTGEMRSGLNPNLCLDVRSGVAASGTPVQIYTCNGTYAQKWYRTSTFEFQSWLNPNLCLDVKGGLPASGTPVQIYTCNGTYAQKWY